MSVLPETAGGPPLGEDACGTEAGYYRHRRSRHEAACDRCRAAVAQAVLDRRLAPHRRAVLDVEVSIYDKQHRGERPS